MTGHFRSASLAAALALTCTSFSAFAQVTFTVEPSNTVGQVLFLRVAPPQAGGSTTGLLCLRIAVNNASPADIVLTNVTVSFGGNPPDQSMAASISIPKGTTSAPWFNASGGTSDCVTLPTPAPSTLTVKLSFSGSPTTTTSFNLKADSPVFAFPGKHSDRAVGELWKASSGTHGPGAEGSQLFAYDMAVIGVDSQTGNWSECFSGIDCNPTTNLSLKNTDFRIWGTPIYAMADGMVVEWMNNVASNTTLGTIPSTCGVVGSGNHFYIKSGDVTLLYAHMQPGSLTPSLMAANAPVKKGDKLGLAGNSGSSSNPHLHIHAMVGNLGVTTVSGSTCLREVSPLLLRPLPFSDASALDTSKIHLNDLTGPWVPLKAEGPPPVKSAICTAGKTGPVPASISSLPGQIKGLEGEKKSLQEELKKAAPSQKPSLANQIKKLENQINDLKKKLATFNNPRCPIDRVACTGC